MISEDDLWLIFGVINSPINGLFDFDEIMSIPIEHVWAIVESGDDADSDWYAIPGYHYVNRLGYVLTQKPWIDDTLVAIYFLDGMDHDNS